jgi:hypothetical protein
MGQPAGMAHRAKAALHRMTGEPGSAGQDDDADEDAR